MAVAESDRATILTDIVARSHLLADQHLQTWSTWIAARPELDSKAALEPLVERKLLTSWQAQQLLLGQQSFFLAGRRLLRRLGVGGMGAVFQARDDATGEVVAIKLLRRNAAKAKATTLARFEREVALLLRLDHPRIVKALESGEVNGFHYLVMEYVHGKDLGAVLTEHRRLPIAIACRLAMQAAEGLAEAHREGCIHRDIKPSNLMISQTPSGDLELKILDFGLARSVEAGAREAQITRSGQIVGTVDYLAPEQTRGAANVDARADIYSLGVTLYEMLAGEVPFVSDTMMGRLVARVIARPKPLSEVNSSIPADLSATVERMLEAEPDKRIQTAAEVAAALRPHAMFGISTDTPADDRSLAATVELAAPVKQLSDDFQKALASHPNLPRLPAALARVAQMSPAMRWTFGGVLAALAILAVCALTLGRTPAVASSRNTETAQSETEPSEAAKLLAEAASLASAGKPTERATEVRRRLLSLAANADTAKERTALGDAARGLPTVLDSLFADGRPSVSLSDGSLLSIFQPKSQKPRLAFAAGDRTLAACQGGQVVFHELLAGTSSHCERDDWSSIAALAAGDRWLAFGGQAGAVYLWDMTLRKCVHELPAGAAVTALALDENLGAVFVGRADGKLERWQIGDGTKRHSADLSSEIAHLAVDPGGRWLAAAAAGGVVTRCDPETLRAGVQFQTPHVVELLATSAGALLVVEPKAVRSDARGGATLTESPVSLAANRTLAAASLSPVSSDLFLVDDLGRLSWHDLTTGKTHSPPTAVVRLGRIRGVKAASDGRRVAVATATGAVHLCQYR